ncbi:MAG: type II toxin-antitoxin system HicA family toxin [Gemmatimonadota bacterium]|uniref:type II toxin-antitoxin system HicA family toxin n=1 Tax=Candidatus Palauibacter scopulicola TaxID=3056741 RepID=UPI00239418BA|nr:type II toxin-antitoxin system HicA family toxin [Candidatus Palauibacter scopulicola]
MKTLSGKDFCRLLEARGWQLRRVRGSHHIYTKEGVAARISVPVYGNHDLKRGLQKHLMKIAEIDESER